ncbi:MAG: tRNA (guanine37-N1)-methyltransferase [Lentimonas sp.]|jgi:tRNA (guanine37-N1)-methyltransferase
MKSNFKVKIFTLFPEIFPSVLGHSIIGEALKSGLWELEIIDIRKYGIGSRKTVDDTIFGGGSGMLMRPDVLEKAIEDNISGNEKLFYPSPRGAVFNQKKAFKISEIKEIAIICGRYEGIDQRVIDEYEIEEISIGDYVLSGGELPAMVILDAVIRNLEGVLGDKNSLKEESFGDGNGSKFDNLLEYPHYTKPQIWKDRSVPEVLLSGHHKNIDDWRLKKAREITQKRRGDLLVPCSD